jgi:hypothetical protein
VRDSDNGSAKSCRNSSPDESTAGTGLPALADSLRPGGGNCRGVCGGTRERRRSDRVKSGSCQELAVAVGGSERAFSRFFRAFSRFFALFSRFPALFPCCAGRARTCSSPLVAQNARFGARWAAFRLAVRASLACRWAQCVHCQALQGMQGHDIVTRTVRDTVRRGLPPRPSHPSCRGHARRPRGSVGTTRPPGTPHLWPPGLPSALPGAHFGSQAHHWLLAFALRTQVDPVGPQRFASFAANPMTKGGIGTQGTRGCLRWLGPVRIGTAIILSPNRLVWEQTCWNLSRCSVAADF